MGTGLLKLTATIIATAAICAAQGTITTVVVTPVSGIAVDQQGNIFTNDESTGVVRKVNLAGAISIIAGTGKQGYSGDGGPATGAQLQQGSTYSGLAMDAAGNLYISDAGNQRVRKVTPAGIISTVAGNGTAGFSGDNGPATQAEIYEPDGLAVDGAGNLYIADHLNNRVRKVTPSGIITTVAGNGNVVDSGDGGQATAAAVHGPEGLAVDSAGNLYISDLNATVRKVNAAGVITTVAGNGTRGFLGDGGPATSAELKSPIGLAVDGAGSLYIADDDNARIRKVTAAGVITTIAGITGNASSPLGDGGPATSAYIPNPVDVKLDSAGNLYVSSGGDANGRVRKISAGSAGPSLTVTPQSLTFSYATGAANPAPQTLSITSSTASLGFTAAASISSGGSGWLSVSPSSGTSPATITVSVNAQGLAAGVYQGAILLTPTGGAAQTFAVTLNVTGANAPTFSSGAVVNASGYQTTLAPGVVFVIFGSGMGPASLAAGAAPDYPTTLAGTSINLTPSSGGQAIDARIVYTAAQQVAGVLPSSITPGTYAMRVTYNGIASAPQNVTVAARSFGIATANSAGTGTAQATIGNVNGGVSLTRFTTGSLSFNGLTWTLTPAHPGDTLVLWGTGGGADPANDTGGTSGDQTAAGNFSVTVDGRQITPLYAGASQGYPGLWQINFTLPLDITADCFASLQVSGGGQMSNLATLPIAPTGQSYCSDPQLTQSELARLDAGGTVALGALAITKESITSGSATTQVEEAAGSIGLYNSAEYAAAFSGLKIGACVLNNRTAAATTKNPAAPEGYVDLVARLPISGPGMTAGAGLAAESANPGPIYGLSIPAGSVQAGGNYTISGTGGTGAGPFSASITMPSSFTVSGWDSLNSINHAQPLTMSWTSSGADTVFIGVSTSAVVGKDASNNNIIHTAAFTCQVPAGSGTYTVPTAMLGYLITGPASLSVEAAKTQPLSITLTSGATAITNTEGLLVYGRTITLQ